ncbi:PH domain-containing protein [Frankia sp. AgB1.9]|uniref:PH domain-containing protein n=1 Tax=unclassified Frankia TaxID=2632575 RepID=UPI0019328801|nr:MULTISPECIES: PH domain-containing protein [unclassified Frankia]MBL7490133.1 PH domain-containing protein [Frankia sp. AgW1.1]MBL7546516.1 PH domain-containing protein [Frankia sp. AgB1.9]MBL7620225.1 PH domain-containing protein [Frankia sp. AgB1.8]
MRQVWYNRSNRFWGYLIMVGSGAMFLVFAFFPAKQDSAGLVLPFFVFSPIALGFWVIFVRPELVATESGITVRNPLFQTDIPWGAVRGFDGSGKYLRIQTVYGAEYLSSATEVANFRLLGRARTANDRAEVALTKMLNDRRAAGNAGGTTVVRRFFLPGPRALIAPTVVVVTGIVAYNLH